MWYSIQHLQHVNVKIFPAVSRVVIFVGGNFMVAILLGGHFPGVNQGGNLPGGNYPGGNYPGGSLPSIVFV